MKVNCLVTAVLDWLRTRLRSYFWVRRSFSFKGLVVHTGTARKRSFRSVAVLEYIPIKSTLWTRRNMLFWFDGAYRVWVLKPVEVRRFTTYEEAQEYINEEVATEEPTLANQLGGGR